MSACESTPSLRARWRAFPGVVESRRFGVRTLVSEVEQRWLNASLMELSRVQSEWTDMANLTDRLCGSAGCSIKDCARGTVNYRMNYAFDYAEVASTFQSGQLGDAANFHRRDQKECYPTQLNAAVWPHSQTCCRKFDSSVEFSRAAERDERYMMQMSNLMKSRDCQIQISNVKN